MAALLLVKIITPIAGLLHVQTEQLYAWTDSMIVLHWLQKLSTTLKTFVANWVSAIQELLPSTQWRHVATKDSPADLLSQGIDAKDLTHCQLWWKGTPWLAFSPALWPTKMPVLKNALPKTKMLCYVIRIIPSPLHTLEEVLSFHHLRELLPGFSGSTTTPARLVTERLMTLSLPQKSPEPRPGFSYGHSRNHSKMYWKLSDLC